MKRAVGPEQLACDLVNGLFVLVKTAMLFDLNNRCLERPMTAFLEKVGKVLALGEPRVSIGFDGQGILFNQSPFRADPGTFANARFLRRVFRQVGAQELQLEPGFSAADLRALLEILKPALSVRQRSGDFPAVAHLTLVPLAEGGEVDEEEEALDPRLEVLQVFASSVALMARTMSQLRRGQIRSPTLLRRLACNLAEANDKAPDLLLGLLHTPVCEGALAAHLVRVAILSLACAKKSGLPRTASAQVAMIALCHHLGSRLEAGSDEVDAPGEPLVESEDPLAAALTLCSVGGINEGLLRRVVAVYEVASAFEGSNPPYTMATADDLLARIVILADGYDRLAATMDTHRALEALLAEHGEREPMLCRLFTFTVGYYPVGTVVQLASGARAVVVESPRHVDHLQRPVVRLLDGRERLDLSAGADSRRSIVASCAAVDNVVPLFLP
jgi:hypothetical protein